MIRLDLSAEPRWLDLGHGVRLHVLPMTTSVMAAARGDAAVDALPDDAGREQMAIALAKAVARLVVTNWEGVGDARGKPVPVTPEGIDALLNLWPVFEAFQARYLAKHLMLEQKKTPQRPRRLALRRGRALLRGLRAPVPGLPSAAEPTPDVRRLAGLGSGPAPWRPAARDPHH